MTESRSTRILSIFVGGLLLLIANQGDAVDERAPRQSKTRTGEIRRIPAVDLRRMEFQTPENISGEIRLRTDVDAANVEMEINKYVHNVSSDERAEKILNLMTVTTEVAENILRVEVKTPERAEWEGTDIGVRVDLEIILPPGWIFHARSDHYDFDLSGPFQRVELIGKYGRIQVDGVTEVAELRTEYGLLSLTAAQGRVEVKNRYGTTALDNITIRGAPLYLRSERGPVTVSDLNGPVDIKVDDAEVTISEWTLETGESRVSTRESPIDVRLAKWGTPQLKIENRNAEVDIYTPDIFSAVIRLEVSGEGNSYIRTRGIPVKATRMDQQTLEGIAGDGGGLLEVNIIGLGDITLRGPHPRVPEKGEG